ARDPQKGETRWGNSLAGMAGFSGFMGGNELSAGLRGMGLFGARVGTGGLGAASSTLGSDAGSQQRLPHFDELVESATSGAAMNVLLPPTLHLAGKAGDTLNHAIGRGVPADRYVETQYGISNPAEVSPKLAQLLNENPWARVQDGAENSYALDAKNRVYLSDGKGSVDQLAHELKHLSDGRTGAYEAGFNAAQAELKAGRVDAAWEKYKEVRLAQEDEARE